MQLEIFGLDMNACAQHLQANHGPLIIDSLHSSELREEQSEVHHPIRIVTLKPGILLELWGGSVEIYFRPSQSGLAMQLFQELRLLKAVPKAKLFEMNIISPGSHGLELRTIPITPTQLDLDLWYNAEFAAVHQTIVTRLQTQDDKGIVLLHGLPGTGKTTYLRYLIGQVQKKILFMSPAVAGSLMNPDFLDLLIDHPNSVLVIEDAENILTDRRMDSSSSVSNLLNLSDGLLSDCVNVQIICTFNSPLTVIDPALMRKGRLIARYEFGRLTVDKGQQLSDHLGFNRTINAPMTVAEVRNQSEPTFETRSVPVVGFRIPALEN